MNKILNDVKAYQKAYEQGYTTGRIHFLERLQEKIHQEADRQNGFEVDYEDKVVKLKDLDELILRLRWEIK